MTAVIVDTRSIAATLRGRLRQDIVAFNQEYNLSPGLVMLGSCEDQATLDYIRILGTLVQDLNIRYTVQLFPTNIRAAEMRRYIEHYNADPSTHAISLLLPLSKQLDAEEIASTISVEKDIEGLHPTNLGRLYMGKPFLVAPSALAATKFLALYNINPANRHIVIIGRDLVTTWPLASLLTKARATVTTCHPTTHHLAAHTRQAEILISGGGQPGLVKADMVRPGAVVIDYGMNYLGKNQVVGDVDFEKVAEVAAAVTPVPAGIGPLTIVCLFENVLKAARAQLTTEATRPSQESVSKGKESYPDSQEVEVGANLLASRNDPVLSSAVDIKGRNNYYN